MPLTDLNPSLDHRQPVRPSHMQGSQRDREREWAGFFPASQNTGPQGACENGAHVAPGPGRATTGRAPIARHTRSHSPRASGRVLTLLWALLSPEGRRLAFADPGTPAPCAWPRHTRPRPVAAPLTLRSALPAHLWLSGQLRALLPQTVFSLSTSAFQPQPGRDSHSPELGGRVGGVSGDEENVTTLQA